MELSIIIPLYNEGKSVRPLCQGIVEAIEPLDYQFETLLVDDGSTDDTFERAAEVAGQDERFRIIKLSRNFGQTAALYAGFEHARGRIIVTMDGDLQNDPQDIGRFMQEMRKGYDVVLGYRGDRKDRFLSRKLPSRIANWFIRKVADTSIKDNGCSLRAYRAEVIKKFPLYSEMHRLLPTILALAGARMTQIKVQHHPRKYGESKYGMARVYKVLIDLLALVAVLTAARLPLFGFGTVAILSGGLGLVTFIAGVVHLVLEPGSSIVVHLGAAMLWGVLSVALLMFGVLSSLIYARSELRMDDLLEVKAL